MLLANRALSPAPSSKLTEIPCPSPPLLQSLQIRDSNLTDKGGQSYLVHEGLYGHW